MGFADRVFAGGDIENSPAGNRAVGATVLAFLILNDGVGIANFL